jgi:AcrR family transcriptional regulator
VATTGKGARTRQRIVRCAATLLAERGIMALNLADVVAAANVTKGALYFHFASKDELIVGVEAEYEADSRQMVAEIGRDPDPLRRLVLLSFALMRRQLRTSLAKAHNRLMLAGLAGHAQSQLSSPPIDWAVTSRVWLQDADQAGLLTPGLDMTAMSESFDDCLIGAVTSHHLEHRTVEPLQRLALLWRLFLLPALVPDEHHRDALEQLVEQEKNRRANPDPFSDDADPIAQVEAGTGSGWSGTAAGRTVGIGSSSAPGAPSGTTGLAGGVGVSRA